jgi:hypothetical protein
MVCPLFDHHIGIWQSIIKRAHAAAYAPKVISFGFRRNVRIVTRCGCDYFFEGDWLRGARHYN